MDQDKSGDNSQSAYVLIATLFVIGSLIAAYFIFPSYQSFMNEAYEVLTSDDESRISAWVSKFGFWGPLFIVAAIVGQMFLIFVNVVLVMLVAILAYGSFWGSLLAILGICIASTVGYFIGNALGEYTVYKLIGKSTKEKVEKYARQYGYAAVIAARLSPLLSNDAISFVAGLMNMNYWKFMGATLAGIVPLTVLMAWMSEDMERLKNGLIWISVAALVVIMGYYLLRERFNNH